MSIFDTNAALSDAGLKPDDIDGVFTDGSVMPALLAQHRGNAPVAVTAVFRRQIDDRFCQRHFIVTHNQLATLCRSGLMQRLTRLPF